MPQPLVHAILAAGLLLAAGSPLHGEEADDPHPWRGVPPLAAEEWARLEQGGTVTRTIPMAGANQRAGLAVRLVRHDPERVVRAVADVDHWREWVPFLKGAERSAAPGPSSRELAFDLPWPLRDRHYRATLRVETSRPAAGAEAPGGTGDERFDPGGREWLLAWLSVPDSGNVQWARGSFLVRELGPGRALVVFRSATDLGEPRLTRSLLDRVMEDSLRWVLDGLAQQVGRCRYTVPYPDGCVEARPSRP